MYLPFIWATSSPHASLTGCICLPFGLHPHWQPQSHRMLLLSHAMSSILTGVHANIQSHRVLLSSLQDSTLTESSVSVTQGAGHTLTEITHQFSYGVYISQLIRFARVCNHVTDFNARNKCLTAKLLQQGYRYHKLRKTFSKFYRRHYELISKYNVGLKTLLSEGLSEPEFYGDLVYKFKKLKGINDFSFQFRKIITRYRRIGYNLNVMRQSACLVFNPIMVDNYAAFFNCTPVGRASDSMMAPT